MMKEIEKIENHLDSVYFSTGAVAAYVEAVELIDEVIKTINISSTATIGTILLLKNIQHNLATRGQKIIELMERKKNEHKN